MKMCPGGIELTLSERPESSDIVIERSGDVIVRAPIEITTTKSLRLWLIGSCGFIARSPSAPN